MLSEEIISEKSGGETSPREMVYEVFVYPFPKIGHYVSVTRTGHRVGAASKREGWGGGYTSPSGCLPYLLHSLLNLHKLSLTLVSASDARVCWNCRIGRGFRALPHVVVIERLPKRKCATRRLIARLGVKKSSLCNGLRIPSLLCCPTCFQEEFLQ